MDRSYCQIVLYKFSSILLTIIKHILYIYISLYNLYSNNNTIELFVAKNVSRNQQSKKNDSRLEL